MPIVTRLVQGKKNPNRVNLYLDDEFAFALSIDEVARHNLKKGLEISPDLIEQLKSADQDEYLYSKILNFLSYRPRTVKEVRDRLWKYELRESAKQDVIIARLQSHGYLDDRAFAEWFISSRNSHRPRSKRYLSAELKAKGIAEDIIQAVSGSISDESATIYHLLEKKLGLPHRLEPAEKQKIVGYLARQGFAWDKITEVVKNWESE